ncbi:MAG: PP2C family protein-serine/threonine phosphatase, partial [Bacteroidetes bacterium]|nr:PP2C family protein-serine/threonine phosphatase [Bacteroidota bacterium]
ASNERRERTLDYWTQNLGFNQLEKSGTPRLRFRSDLVKAIQRSGEEHPNPFAYWEQYMDVEGEQRPSLFGGDGSSRSTTLIFEFTQDGQLVAFQNPGRWLPERRVESLDTHGQLVTSEAEQQARDFLNSTVWSTTDYALTSFNSVAYDQETVASLTFSSDSTYPGVEQTLRVDVTSSGEVVALEPSVSIQLAEGGVSEDLIEVVLRGLLIVGFAVWLLYRLYTLIRARTIDIQSSIIYASLIALLFPLIQFSTTYASVVAGEFEPSLIEWALFVVVWGAQTSIVSVIFFLVSGVGESVTRSTMSSKLQTLDSLRTGRFFNPLVGQMLVRSVLIAGILLGGVTFMLSLNTGRAIGLPDMVFSDQYTFHYLFFSLELGLFALIGTQALYLNAFQSLSKWLPWKWATAFLISLIYGVMGLAQMDIGPLWMEILLGTLVGLGVTATYIRFDFLHVLAVQILFLMGVHALESFGIGGMEEMWLFYTFLGLIVVSLTVGISAMTFGQDPDLIERYVPDYMEELAQQERMSKELSIAQEVQESFLPTQIPDALGTTIVARCTPASETGGDYYDVIRIDDEKLGLVIGDVSGKGIQAAFFMTFIKGILHALARSEPSTVGVVKRANAHFRENAPVKMFMTLLYGVLDTKKQTFRFTRAGHHPLWVQRAQSGAVEEYLPDGVAIGMTDIDDASTWLEELEVSLHPGDRLFLFTDGLTEARDRHGVEYGEVRLKRMIEQYAEVETKEVVARLFEAIEELDRHSKPLDDMTLLVVEIPGKHRRGQGEIDPKALPASSSA